ncbi:MAG: UDP-N-acetylmuramoyl-L-alanine--D-glutamate ligase, partial [Clostridia bacterium]
VFTKKNVTFINDSKATNVDSTIFAISSFNGGIHLLLGGLSKGQDFSKLFMSEYISSVKMFYIYGKDKDIILSAAKNFVEDERLSICKNMADAFFVAEKNCKEGETLLLSPACSSFDEFANYEERGEKFRSLVKEVEDD